LLLGRAGKERAGRTIFAAPEQTAMPAELGAYDACGTWSLVRTVFATGRQTFWYLYWVCVYLAVLALAVDPTALSAASAILLVVPLLQGVYAGVVSALALYDASVAPPYTPEECDCLAPEPPAEEPPPPPPPNPADAALAAIAAATLYAAFALTLLVAHVAAAFAPGGASAGAAGGPVANALADAHRGGGGVAHARALLVAALYVTAFFLRLGAYYAQAEATIRAGGAPALAYGTADAATARAAMLVRAGATFLLAAVAGVAVVVGGGFWSFPSATLAVGTALLLAVQAASTGLRPPRFGNGDADGGALGTPGVDAEWRFATWLLDWAPAIPEAQSLRELAWTAGAATYLYATIGGATAAAVSAPNALLDYILWLLPTGTFADAFLGAFNVFGVQALLLVIWFSIFDSGTRRVYEFAQGLLAAFDAQRAAACT
jgi:hypothetical protein